MSRERGTWKLFAGFLSYILWYIGERILRINPPHLHFAWIRKWNRKLPNCLKAWALHCPMLSICFCISLCVRAAFLLKSNEKKLSWKNNNQNTKTPAGIFLRGFRFIIVASYCELACTAPAWCRNCRHSAENRTEYRRSTRKNLREVRCTIHRSMHRW